MLFINENPIKDLIFETFTVEKSHKGITSMYSLTKNGEKILVNEDNKSDYVDLRFKFEIFENIKLALLYLLHGFYSVVPKNLISIFTYEEIELLLCGLPYIDLEDWKDNTEYRGYTRKSKIIRWFWKILKGFSQKRLSDLVMFVTGTPRLPVEGFTSLRTMRGDSAKFTIEAVETDENDKSLPKAHTCFNRLDLPKYHSKSALKRGLLYVIRNHKLGFGME